MSLKTDSYFYYAFYGLTYFLIIALL